MPGGRGTACVMKLPFASLGPASRILGASFLGLEDAGSSRGSTTQGRASASAESHHHPIILATTLVIRYIRYIEFWDPSGPGPGPMLNYIGFNIDNENGPGPKKGPGPKWAQGPSGRWPRRAQGPSGPGAQVGPGPIPIQCGNGYIGFVIPRNIGS